MKAHKKLLAIAFAAVLAVASASVLPSKAAASEKTSGTLDLYQEGGFAPISEGFVSYSKNISRLTGIFSYGNGSIQQTIYNGLLNCSASIDISKYNLTSEQVKTVVTDVINTSPDLFYVDNRYSLSLSGSNTVTAYIPQYKVTGSTLEQQKSFYNQQMDIIMDKIDPSWTDLQKIIFVHDYLAQNFEYDTSYSIYDAYNFFRAKKGVCQAYTVTFCGIMDKLGIEVSIASSDAMKHIWNLVKLNGNWYHVDVTWDDPVSDRFSLANHNYLLLSDTEVQKGSDSSDRHHDWTSNYKCTSSAYDNSFWKTGNISSPFKYFNGKWYFCAFNSEDKEAALYSYDFNNSISKIASLGKWITMNNPNSYYTTCYSGLDVYNGKLYFNSQDTIYSYSGGNTSAVKQISSSSRLYGLRTERSGNNITLTYGTTSDYSNVTLNQIALGTETPKPVTTPPSQTQTPTIPPVTQVTTAPGTQTTTPPGTQTATPPQGSPALGDLTGDGTVDLRDANAALRAALSIIKLSGLQEQAADVNHDSNINLTDANMILRVALSIDKF